MDYFVTALVFVIVFSILILVHEFGHFIMAKRAGIKVEEFGIGLPPRIWGKKKGETIYSINWIPFGGFVRMLGESDVDGAMAKQKRSFVAQPMRKRVQVIVAGVLMNFLLAWLLFSIGFTVGMKPLLAPDDFLPAVKNGIIELEEGVRIKDVASGSLGEQVGLLSEDLLFEINGQSLSVESINAVLENPAATYSVIRNNEVFTYEIVQADNSLGLDFYDFVPMPRVKVFDVANLSVPYNAGIRSGDIILSVNGEQVFSVTDFENLIRGAGTLEYEIYRDGLSQPIILEMNPSRQVIVSRVLPHTPAEESGLRNGDIIFSVNGLEFHDSEKLILYIQEHAGEKLAILIERASERIFYEIAPVSGKIGVMLSELRDYGEDQDMSVYNVDLLSTVENIKDEKLPLHKALYRSLAETVRVAELTATMFKDFLLGFVRTGDVPESVSGPVGIAQMTHIFVQEGFIALIRFVAILSLSLAVINILPLPALDGGRLLFVLIELIIGRRVNAKWESYIHALGYGLILLLILAVTYSDILKLIG